MLKKNQVLKYLPKAKAFAKEADVKSRQGEKLIREAQKAREISDYLSGVVLHENFPIRVSHYSGGTEITCGCDGAYRSSFVKPVGDTRKYVVTTYTDNGDDGNEIQGEYSKNQAFRMAKDFVAFGKKNKVPKPQTTKRGLTS